MRQYYVIPHGIFCSFVILYYHINEIINTRFSLKKINKVNLSKEM